MINPRQHIAEIRSEKFWLDETGRLKGKNPLASDLQDSIRHLAEGLYSKNAHFIFELIQNAEDNTYKVKEPSLSFRLVKTDPTETPGSEGVLIVQNNEIGFSSDNVDAICAVGKTTKSKIKGYIGEKGIGFKSVFRVTSNPHIFSNGYAFCLPEQDEETGLGYIVPQWINNVPKGIDPSQTTIILPLDKADFGYGTIEEMLRDIEPETILFLSKLKEIKVETDTGDALTILKDDNNMPQVQIMIEGTMQGESFSKVDEFLLYAKAFEKPLDITHEKRIGIDQRDVSIAFPLSEDKESAGKIFAYLPVRSDTGLPFLINADFILTSSREEILDIPWNRRWLMGCVAELAAFVLPRLKERGLLTISLLEALAHRLQEISENSIFYPIVRSISDAFKNDELIPTDDWTFVKAQNAKLARGSELRNLLNHDQLGLLFQSPHVIKWLSAEITEVLTPNLRRYLMVQLGVEELRPEKFVELLTDDFLENQDDKWIIDFYTFLGKDRTELWKKPDAPLRKRKFIRLEDNSHVVPFKSDGTPNAYLPSSLTTKFPTIRKSIFSDEFASDFLKRLGIIEPDLFADIIEFILPKYTEDRIVVGYEENIDDLKKIKKLLDEPYQGSLSSSLAKLRILLGKLGLSALIDYLSKAEPGELIPILLKKMVLPSIRFLRASNGLRTEYKSPNDMYKNTPELRHYFQDNPEAWFICDDYPDEFLSLFHELEINERPKVTQRNSDNNGFVIISKSHRCHERGTNSFDPDITVDGLENAITNPTTQKSAFIWNSIALPHLACIRGIIEKSSKKTYENSKKEARISDFGRLLNDTEWLPSPNGCFSKPGPICLNDLPGEFEKDTPRAKSLSLALKMRQAEHEQALEVVTGGDPDFKMLIEHYQSASDDERKKILKTIPGGNPPEPAPSFKDGLKNLGRSQRGIIKPSDKEISTVSNHERYQEKLNEQVGAEVEEYQSTPRRITFSPVRDLPSNAEARRFLYEQYHGRCQVTGTTFPKASSNTDGVAEYYFEACSLLSYANADYLNDAGNMLCVSADIMAKFKFASITFLDSLEDAIEMFKVKSKQAENISVKIQLAGEECSIKWDQRHFMRLLALYEKA
jgi:hypothetical protein